MKIYIELLLILVIVGIGIIYTNAPEPEIILKIPNDINMQNSTNS